MKHTWGKLIDWSKQQAAAKPIGKGVHAKEVILKIKQAAAQQKQQCTLVCICISFEQSLLRIWNGASVIFWALIAIVTIVD